MPSEKLPLQPGNWQHLNELLSVSMNPDGTLIAIPSGVVSQTDFDNHVAQTTSVHGVTDTGKLIRGFGGGRENFQDVGNSGASKTIDLANGNVQKVTLTNNCTLTFANTGTSMDTSHSFSFLLLVVQDTSVRSVTWPGAVTWLTGTPTLDPASGALSTFFFYTVDNNVTWYGSQLSGQSGQLVNPDEAMSLPGGFITDAGGFTTTPAVAQSLSRTRQNIANQSPTILVSGTLLIFPLSLRKGIPLTGGWFMVGTTALVAGTSPHQWYVLLDNDGTTILRKSVDDVGNAWAANKGKLLKWQVSGVDTPYTPTRDGLYYIGINVAMTGGTLPTLLGTGVNSAPIGVNTNETPILFGAANTGLTDPASLSSVTARSSWAVPANAHMPWCGVY